MKWVKYIGGGLLAVVAVLVAIGMILPRDEEVPARLYDRAPVPAVPAQTAAVGEVLGDGQYWAASLTLGADGQFAVTLQQAAFGPACVELLGPEGCDGEYGVQPEPSRELEVALAADTAITVAAANGQNYVVFTDELATLLAGGTPAAEAPDDYAYVAFPYLATVTAGEITELRQIWLP